MPLIVTVCVLVPLSLGLPVVPLMLWECPPSDDTLPEIPGTTGVFPLLGVTAPDDPPKAP